jgi:hypothetical protein
MTTRAALLVLALSASPALAQAPVTPVRPPPVRQVCATGPTIADFCELRTRIAPGASCTCSGPNGPVRGRAELR